MQILFFLVTVAVSFFVMWWELARDIRGGRKKTAAINFSIAVLALILSGIHFLKTEPIYIQRWLADLWPELLQPW